MNYFAISVASLRDRAFFLDEVYQRIKLDKKILAYLISSSLFFAIYGAIMGSFGSWLQILVSAIKLPALYLLTTFICLPTLYFFELVAGVKRVFEQYMALLLASMSVISVMLFAFAPITLFFRLSIDNYRFFVLVNILILAITGFTGIRFFYNGMVSLTKRDGESSNISLSILKAWLLLYGLVGSQLGWTLRPFFGDPGLPFTLFRQIESNFYLQIAKLFLRVFFGHQS
jgi:hypothetical protein